MGPVIVEGVLVRGPEAAFLASLARYRRAECLAMGLALPEHERRLFAELEEVGARWLAEAAEQSGTSDVPLSGSDGSMRVVDGEPMSTSRAAELLGIGERGVRALVARGRLQGRRSGNRLLVEPASVFRLRAERGVA